MQTFTHRMRWKMVSDRSLAAAAATAAVVSVVNGMLHAISSVAVMLLILKEV